MKYGFTYVFHRHVVEFWGPYDSIEETMAAIKTMAAPHSDDGLGDYISDELNSDEDYVYDHLRIKIYSIEEQPVNKEEIVQLWKDDIYESMTASEKRMKKEQYEKDKSEYERLKEKFLKEEENETHNV